MDGLRLPCDGLSIACTNPLLFYGEKPQGQESLKNLYNGETAGWNDFYKIVGIMYLSRLLTKVSCLDRRPLGFCWLLGKLMWGITAPCKSVPAIV